jgi:DNA-binding NtrC family response regulator
LRDRSIACYPAGVDAAELIFHREGKDLLHVRLHQAEICIGSHATNDVLLPDPSVPAVAFVLVDCGAGRFKLRDLTGGALHINKQPATRDEVELKDRDEIAIGTFELRFQVTRSGEPAHRHTTVLDQSGPSRSKARVRYQGRSHRLTTERPFNVGSDEDNDLVVEDEFVSSFHCRITCGEDGRWRLVDLASTNGTSVNGLRVGQAELPSSATILIGRAELIFDVQTPAAEAGDRARDADTGDFAGMIGGSAKMERVFELVRRLADAPAPVLITGESGSGKELIARALHDHSAKKSGPFLAINCGALAASIIESELFGHVKGAFTGAQTDKKGAFEAAQNGTLFLDEVGELPLELQPKLLRVLESRSVRRVGGTSETPVDTRIVAATHRNLRELVEDGSFREDLFHRLFVLTINVPSLRERPEDILPIVRHFLRTLSSRGPLRLAKDAENALENYPWPGNVRELRNVILRAILLTDRELIEASDLHFSEDAFKRGDAARLTVRRADEEERDRITAALDEAGMNKAEAARILGISKSTLHDRMKRHGLLTPPRRG